MCLDNSPRCVWVTHEKECVYSHLFVCSFEDKNRCVAVTHFVLECTKTDKVPGHGGRVRYLLGT